MTKVILFTKKLDRSLGLLSPILFVALGPLSLILSLYYFVISLENKTNYMNKKELFQVLKFLVSIFPAIILISIISKLILPEYAEQHQVVELKKNFDDEIKRSAYIIIIIAPILEETIFRGFFYRALKLYFPWFISAIFSSLLFSLIHQNILAFSMLFTLSIFLTFIYEMHGKIIYPIITHSVFNVVMLTFIYLGR